ncbi:terpenoid synthase [Hysterangium stoloniferum]|nr:terpenoid synthase [Hysterangium stoloniferum]
MATITYNNFLERLSNSSVDSWWRPENETALVEPFTYLTSTGGKEIRKKMIQAFNLWLKVPEDTVNVVASVVGMLHSASLIMDDVEDDSQLRRGQPVTHKIYGIPQAINSANYVYFLAYKQLFVLKHMPPHTGNAEIELERIVTDELLNLHRGQGLDLLWRDNLVCPTEEEYINMVNNKTGGLFRIAIKLMMAKSSSTVNYIPLVNLISIYFQIRDDYMNLHSSEYESNKGFAEDLTEGKFSFPIVHSVREDVTNRRVLNVLQKRPKTPTTKRYVIDYMRDHTKSFEYTAKVLNTLERQAREEIEKLGGNSALIAILDALSIKA